MLLTDKVELTRGFPLVAGYPSLTTSGSGSRGPQTPRC